MNPYTKDHNPKKRRQKIPYTDLLKKIETLQKELLEEKRKNIKLKKILSQSWTKYVNTDTLSQRTEMYLKKKEKSPLDKEKIQK